MTRPKAWIHEEPENLHDCRVFRLARAPARSPHSGESHTFYRIDADDWVNVVPVTRAGEIVMVRQYRHGARAVTLEIPGGMVDPGETPAEAAARELLEETGYAGASLEPLGAVNPNPAVFGNRCHTFVMRLLLKASTNSLRTLPDERFPSAESVASSFTFQSPPAKEW